MKTDATKPLEKIRKKLCISEQTHGKLKAEAASRGMLLEALAERVIDAGLLAIAAPALEAAR